MESVIKHFTQTGEVYVRRGHYMAVADRLKKEGHNFEAEFFFPARVWGFFRK